MAKKSTKISLTTILTIVVAALGLLAFCTIFMNIVGAKEAEEAYKGLDVAFGYSQTSKLTGKEVEISGFCFWAFITFLFPIAGAVVSYLAKDKLIGNVIAAVLFVIGFILMCFMVKFFANACWDVVAQDKVASAVMTKENYVSSFVENAKLSVGAIVFLISSGLAAVATVAKSFVK